MTAEGGGWTGIFVSDSGRCSDVRPRHPATPRLAEEPHDYFTTCARDNLRYTVREPALRVGATDREVLIGFVGRTGALLGGESRARFLQPDEWASQSPMAYVSSCTQPPPT